MGKMLEYLLTNIFENRVEFRRISPVFAFVYHTYLKHEFWVWFWLYNVLRRVLEEALKLMVLKVLNVMVLREI